MAGKFEAIEKVVQRIAPWNSLVGVSWVVLSVTGYDQKLKKVLKLTKDGKSDQVDLADHHADHIDDGNPFVVKYSCGNSLRIN